MNGEKVIPEASQVNENKITGESRTICLLVFIYFHIGLQSKLRRCLHQHSDGSSVAEGYAGPLFQAGASNPGATEAKCVEIRSKAECQKAVFAGISQPSKNLRIC